MRKFWKKPVALFLCLVLVLSTLGIQTTRAEESSDSGVSVSLTVLQRTQGEDETFTDAQDSSVEKTAATYDISVDRKSVV